MRVVILAAAGGYSSAVVKSVASWSVRSREESERERAAVAQHTKTERGEKRWATVVSRSPGLGLDIYRPNPR